MGARFHFRVPQVPILGPEKPRPSEIVILNRVPQLRGPRGQLFYRGAHIPVFGPGILFILFLSTLLLSACRPHDFPQYAPNYREFAYVANGNSGTVTVLDVVNVRVDREIPVGIDPVAVAANASRNEVYIVNSGSAGGQGSITVIDTEKNTVAATIPVHRRPVSIAIDAAGTHAYVVNSGSNTISVLDLSSRREIAVIGAGEEPAAARLSPDGAALVVANRGGNSVSIVDPSARRVRSVFEGCPGAADIVILPDSTKA